MASHTSQDGKGGALQSPGAGTHPIFSQIQVVAHAFNDLSFLLRHDGTVIEYSIPRLHAFPFAPEQLLNRKLPDIMPRDSGQLLQDALDKVCETRASFCIECLLTLPAGDHVYQTCLLPLQNADGVLEVAVVLRDITSFANTSRERDHLATVLESTPDYVGMCDKDGGGLYLNLAARRALGIGEDEDISELKTTSLHPPQAIQHLRETAIPYAIEHGVWSGESVMLHRSGREIPISHVIITHKNSEGQVEYFSSIARDISEQKANEKALREAEARYRSIFENAIEGIFQSTPEGRYTAANSMLARIYGFDTPEELMESITDIGRQLYLDPGRRKEFSRLLRKHGSVARFESPVRRKDGRAIWISENSREIRDQDGKLIGYEGTVTDITERKQIEQQLKHQAFHDSLTGLPNRILFMDRVGHALARLQRKTTSNGLAILFLDLDRFKIINDSLGHESGDRLLIETARRLEKCLRPDDTAARLGGDEFTILLEDVEDLATATSVADRIAEALQIPLQLRGHDVSVTTSIGIVLSSGKTDTADTLLRDADIAMYRAKANGRAQYEVFDPETHARATERLHLESDLRLALERNEMFLHYQPKYELAHGRLVGFEALVRWQHPRHGLISPAEFIPLAEETGLILALGDWVMRESCKQAWAWRQEYSRDVEISVNLSARQLRQPHLVKCVQDALTESGLPARLLKLEITETVVMEDAEHTIKTLRDLYDLGVRLSIDDFGTGYSSLSYLSRFPITTLKVDRSFVTKMSESAEDTEIVRAIVMLAKALNLETVAEGIEIESQLNELKSLGCDRGQGFLFSRPVAPGEAARLLASSS